MAYRMLGSRAEAEDILQEAWLRWNRSEQVASPGAWLTTTVTHLCLDHANSARVRREHYVGPWLPEPLETTTEAAESERVDPETLSVAFLLVLERLTPTERAVFLLRKVFDSDYREIASTLEKSEEAVRQLFHRAEKHMSSAKPRFAPSRSARQCR